MSSVFCNRMDFMRQLFGWVAVLILIFTTTYFYNAIKRHKFTKIQFWRVIVIYTGYRFLTAGMMSWIVRIPMSFIFLVVILSFLEKQKSWTALFVSYLVVTTLDWLAILLMGLTIGFFGLNENHFGVVLLFFLFLIFGTLIFKIHSNQEALESYGLLLESKVVRLMIFAVGFLLLIVSSLILLSGTLDIASELIPSIIIMGSALIFTIAIIILVILTARHLFSERKKQQALEEENEQLRMEKLIIEEKSNELLDTLKSLQLSFSQLESNHHAYKYLVPVLMGMQNKLTEELINFSDNTHEEKLAIINDYSNQIKVLGREVNFKFVDDYIKTEVASLNIPNEWIDLTVLLERIMLYAKEKKVQLSLFNYVESWGQFVSNSSFIKLLSNIADNAIKESAKVDDVARGAVQLILHEKNGVISFEVRDSAPEFEIHILKNLGRRKNSTNGTGDGFSEIIAALEESSASLIIEEWKNNDRTGKSISVSFDGYGMKLINSHYRSQLLLAELNNEFEVMF